MMNGGLAWSPQETLLAINILELRAIHLVLLWLMQLKDLPEQAQLDSAIAVVSINHQEAPEVELLRRK